MKTQTTTKNEPHAERVPLRVRLAELQTRRRVVIARIVELESKGTVPTATPAASVSLVRAVALLAGASEAEPPATDAGLELLGLFQEREDLDRALILGSQQMAAEEAIRVRALMVSE